MVDQWDKNIFVAGNQNTVVDFCENFIGAGYEISGLIHTIQEIPITSERENEFICMITATVRHLFYSRKNY